jgi:hypothetical protein
VSGSERNRMDEETVLGPVERPLASLEEVVEACLPTMAARLWATCCWSSTPGSGWKIGDFNFLIAEVCPDRDTALYTQFWSEPNEPVQAEVCSGEWNPGAVKYVRQPQRERLQTLGYSLSGEASNFSKKLPVRTSAEAEGLAREVLGIFFDVFGYRGQWPLVVKRHQGERADHAPVYSWLTPGDFQRLATHLGFALEPRGGKWPTARLRRGKREFQATLADRVEGKSRYSSVVLEAVLETPRGTDAAALGRLGERHPFVRIMSGGPRSLVLAMPLRLDGGVTVDWMANAFRHWFGAWRRCERLLRAGAGEAPRPGAGRASGPVVH